MHVSCLDVPRAQGHVEDIKAKYGEGSNAYRVRVLGEFATSDDETVIPLELVLGAVGRNVSSLEYYPVWGVDVARFGDDRTALAKRQKNKLLEPVKSWNSTELGHCWEDEGRVRRDTIRLPGQARFWSTLSVSAPGSTTAARNSVCRCAASSVGEAAASRENCARLRDEWWFKGREWFQDRACSMPKDDALIAELTGPTYAFASTGKMVVELKADMKKRGMRSPDLADAFLLTFACGEERKIQRYRRPVRKCSAWAA